jgi:heterodisulfide reductase subunit A
MGSVLVVGGGITGIQASLDLSQLGFDVILLERESELGGKLRKLSRLFPREESAKELLDAKRSQLKGKGIIQIKTKTEIEKVETKPSGYKIDLKGDGTSLEVGAVVLATGFDPFDPSPIEEYGYGRLKDVITAFELEEMLKEEKILRPSNGPRPQKITFLQCVGSRDRKTNRYCSSFCCTYAIKEALALKKLIPESEISIMYMDIRTPYLYEHLYAEAREKGIQFIRSRVSGISEKDGLLNLDIENTLTRESEAFPSELVVLSIGGEPSASTTQLADQFKLPLSDQGFFKVEEAPVKTTAEGVFIAGAASGLKDIPHCLAEASASALYVSTFLSERKQ